MKPLRHVAERLPWAVKIAIKVALSYHLWKFLGTGGSISGRYCYSVWLRHLVMAHTNGLCTTPTTVAELGPGDSLGIGLAALLCGAKRYYALDLVQYAETSRNLALLDELVALFQKREGIPDHTEFPVMEPPLESYEFPSHILTDERLQASLSPERMHQIRSALMSLGGDNGKSRPIHIEYVAPWHATATVKADHVDMIFSQAVLEHIDDLERTYMMLHEWLKPGGFMSHEIDFKSHNFARQWNGHWAYSDRTWRLLRGTKPYLINRRPHSTHIELLTKSGFNLVCDSKNTRPSEIQRRQLAKRFQNLTDEDLMTSSAFIQAVK